VGEEGNIQFSGEVFGVEIQLQRHYHHYQFSTLNHY